LPEKLSRRCANDAQNNAASSHLSLDYFVGRQLITFVAQVHTSAAMKRMASFHAKNIQTHRNMFTRLSTTVAILVPEVTFSVRLQNSFFLNPFVPFSPAPRN